METTKRKKRSHVAARCEGCGLHLPLCVCAGLPIVRMPFRWILVQHGVEVDRPTNTGRMIRKMFPETERVLYGRQGIPLDIAPLMAADTDYLILYPGPESETLKPENLRPAAHRRLALILLDGTWRQAAHMSRRIARLREIPRVRLPDGRPGVWTIRTPNAPCQLCTLEAAIRTVRLAGQLHDARDLQISMEWIQLRMLYMKGLRPRPADRREAENHVDINPA
ncbi:MAG: tRNA-uridine aminocarboxypropyltransferase [Kiritimatiellia bacterium]|nr:tRNA-uridine aminocarboxypropyltransferase [Kiritimatiellia bacterium]